MKYQFQAFPFSAFAHYFSMDDATLRSHGITKQRVHAKPGYPCRVSLKDGEIGEEVLLLPYEHHAVAGPYRSSGPIFIRKNAQQDAYDPNTFPEILKARFLSLRAYDATGMMRDATTAKGNQLKALLPYLFEQQPDIAYIDIHNAGPGCYNCRAVRVAD